MAISRDQPMRPALDDVLDAIDAQGESITTLAALLPSTNFTEESTVASAIAAAHAWYRKGRETVTVAASSSDTVTVAYGEAFDAGTICMVIHGLDATSAADADVTVTLDSSDEAGLVFTVANASADDPKTVGIGYFTIGA